jgi:hypothetical protein
MNQIFPARKDGLQERNIYVLNALRGFPYELATSVEMDFVPNVIK